VCQFGALTVQAGVSVVDVDACMGCGVYKAHCESGAVPLVRDHSKGEPLEIQERIVRTAADAQVAHRVVFFLEAGRRAAWQPT